MATKKKTAKKHAAKAKKTLKRPVEIVIAADGTVPAATHVSIANGGRVYWKSADRKIHWEVYFLCDPFDRGMTTSRTNGKTKTFSLHKRVFPDDQFNFHVFGPLNPKKDQTQVSNLGSIVVES